MLDPFSTLPGLKGSWGRGVYIQVRSMGAENLNRRAQQVSLRMHEFTSCCCQRLNGTFVLTAAVRHRSRSHRDCDFF